VSFGRAITGLSLFGRTGAYELLQTGKASSALPRALLPVSEAETAEIDRSDDLLAEWIRQVVYTATALLIGYGMIRAAHSYRRFRESCASTCRALFQPASVEP
jgi:hypothetical protein